MRKLLFGVAIGVVAIVAVGALVIGAGLYNVAADEEHSALVYRLIEATRERSIAARASDIEVPNLNDRESVRRGAGNYDAMCASCHLGPGAKETEISRGQYPRPPNLASAKASDPARAFWIIKHGIKATGMPAWGKSMEDSYIWDMVAFLKQLPQMDAEQYRAEVRASGGHSHGGGETMEESDEHGEEGHSHDEEGQESGGSEHSHSGGGHSHDGTDEPSRQEAERSGDRKPANAASRRDPVAVVKAFHQALSAGSAAEVEAVLNPKVLIMEGGNVERSRAEYASHHLPSDLKFMSAMRYQLQRQTGDTVGDLAWVSSWQIVHIHWSSRNAKNA